MKLILLITSIFFFSIISMTQPGANDPTFNPDDVGFGFGDGANGAINSCVIQPDGKILIGGTFTLYNGIPVNRIARLNEDGSLDNNFETGLGASDRVQDIVLQPDGKIIITGNFTSYDGTDINRIARINSDGSIDPTFDPGLGASGEIYTLALQTDNKIIVGGTFTTFNETPTKNIIRLNSNGDIDNSFQSGNGPNHYVRTTSIQSDGKILIGGDFTEYDSNPINRLARLNLDGSLDEQFDIENGFNNLVRVVVVKPDNNILVGGQFNSFNDITVDRLVELDENGVLNTSFSSGISGGSVSCLLLQSDEKIIVGGLFSQCHSITRNNITRIQEDGAIDLTFDPGTGFISTPSTVTLLNENLLIGGSFSSYNNNGRPRLVLISNDGSTIESFNSGTGANSKIAAIALQNDGKIIIGGSFMSYQGVGRNGIARLNADGTLDESFDPGLGVTGEIECLFIQPDGKIIIGGNFSSYDGITVHHLTRLNEDGNLDETFDHPEIDWKVNAVAVQDDGKIIIGGEFMYISWYNKMHIARLNSNGTVDDSFDPGSGPNGVVHTIAIQSNGKILVGGAFTSYDENQFTNLLVRLNEDGSRDPFTTIPPLGEYISVNSISIQADDKILIGGAFVYNYGVQMNNLTRLNPTGELDNSFTTGIGDGNILHTNVQPDGKIILCGGFSEYNGVSANNIVRVSEDGTIDHSFDSEIGANGVIFSSANQSDGKILIVGNFTAYEEVGRNRVARIISNCVTEKPTGESSQEFCNSATVQDLLADGNNIKWYSSASDDEELTPETELEDNSSYFASQTMDDCESEERIEVLVTILQTQKPIGENTQSFCEAATVEDLLAQGNDIKWYSSASDDEELTPETELEDNSSYFASQTVDECESQERLMINVIINNSPDNSITLENGTLTSNELDAEYQWIDCTTNSPIPNETNPTFTPASNGSYAVELYKNSCIDTSTCVEINTSGINYNSLHSIVIYPNPSTDFITIKNLEEGILEIRNTEGKIVKKIPTSSMHSTINIENLSSGVYTINYFRQNKAVYQTKFIKN